MTTATPWLLRAASVPLFFAGPCFQLNVSNQVTVDGDGSSRRTTTIQTTDTDRVDLCQALPAGQDAPQKLLVLTATPYAPTAPTFPSGQANKKGAAWTRTHGYAADETARDLTLHRRGRPTGAGNAAIATVDNYILFQRVRYEETIADNATASTAGAEAERMAGLLARILQRAAEDLLARDYDLGALQQYLSTSGQAAIRDLLFSSIDANSDPSAVIEGIVKILEREKIGVSIPLLRRLGDGELESREDVDKLVKSLREGFLKKTASLLRRHGSTPEAPGAPVALDDLDRIVTNDALERALTRAAEAVTQAKAGEWEKSLTRRVDDLYGSFGGALFDPDLGSDSVSWTTTLRMPGTLIRTSGTPLPNGEILWHFLSGDLALRQTPCTAESVVLDERAIASLGGVAGSATRIDLLELLIDMGVGRGRKPVKSKCKTLADAVNGDAAARERVRKHDDFELVRRVFQLHP